MSRLHANLILVLTAAIWGAGFVAQDSAMAHLGALWFVGLRFLLAFFVALPLAMREHQRVAAPLSGRELGIFALIGLALFGGASTQQLGLLTTSVTNSSFLTGLYVIIVPVLSVIVLRKLPHWIVWPAALLATTGIYYLSGGDLAQLTIGDLLTILCALFWAGQVLLVGMFAPGSDRPMALSAVQFLVCALGGLTLALFLEPIAAGDIVDALPELLYAGLFSSGIAFILQVIGQRWTSAPQAAIFLSSESLFGALFGALLLGERMGWIGYIGCALIFIAMLLVELVPEISKKRRAQ
ncbi:drug/metabolite transporter (DMT)-like permease [Rhizobium sp. SG_E_25_P2]|uniref:DMT family transporter n=1 Tax=Rhizobium sp. SG_E_25_P2 TaxID=2879942 RepID=UPI002472E86F|nr:DMT family transporter [Rhizobium sp. SG_E_25_P2]MDH6266950.1 drug/metabolite transporter (DMT)-like permease [Rhizobium sp. SG_E_25_P2]